MTCDLSLALRQVIDLSNGINNNLGLNAYTVNLVYVTKTPVDIYGEGGTTVITETPLLVGPNLDGYPQLRQISSKDIFLSGGLLTDKDYQLGPLAFPYTTCADGYSAGFDIILTNPLVPIEDTSTQVYFKVTGPDFPLGCYFKRISDKADSNVCYYLFIRNIGTKLI